MRTIILESSQQNEDGEVEVTSRDQVVQHGVVNVIYMPVNFITGVDLTEDEEKFLQVLEAKVKQIEMGVNTTIALPSNTDENGVRQFEFRQFVAPILDPLPVVEEVKPKVKKSNKVKKEAE